MLKTSKSISEHTRYKILSYVLMAVIFFTGLSSIFNIATGKDLNLNYGLQYLSVLVYIYLFCDLLISKNVSALSLKLNLYLLLHLPLRILLTGGEQAVIVFAYVAHTVLVYALNGPRYGLMMFVWISISIVALPFFDVQTVVEDRISMLLSSVLLFLNCVFVMIFVIQEKILFAKALGDYERERVVAKIMDGLIEKIKINTKASRELLDSKSTTNYEDVDEVKKSCLELSVLVQEMAKAAEKGVLLDRLKQEENNVGPV